MTHETVRVQGLSKIYPGAPKPVHAAHEVTFAVHQGEIVGLLGPNGAGKTTIIKCLCGLLRPTSGNIWLNGINVLREPRRALRSIAAVFEGSRNIYWRLTVRENLDFFAAIHGIARRQRRGIISEAIRLFHLDDKANTPTRMLSRGMQQKLAVACALVKQTPILLLDEPTLGLDVETSYELRVTLRELSETGGRTILFSSHDMHVVQDTCERVLIINRGRLVTDARVQELLALWRRSAYRFRFKRPMNDAQLQRLRQALKAPARLESLTTTQLEVELPDGDQLYDLVGLLRSSGVSLDAIEPQEINLEQAFLAILRERGEAVC